MDSLEEKIRKRAYELWERAGRTGAPEDHWLQAERELTGGSQDTGATLENAPPLAAVEAADSAAPENSNGEKKARGKRNSAAPR
jgi:hypothetical protein